MRGRQFYLCRLRKSQAGDSLFFVGSGYHKGRIFFFVESGNHKGETLSSLAHRESQRGNTLFIGAQVVKRGDIFLYVAHGITKGRPLFFVGSGNHKGRQFRLCKLRGEHGEDSFFIIG